MPLFLHRHNGDVLTALCSVKNGAPSRRCRCDDTPIQDFREYSLGAPCETFGFFCGFFGVFCGFSGARIFKTSDMTSSNRSGIAGSSLSSAGRFV
jgi:hypothetical protein